MAELKQIRELEKANGKDTKKTTGRIAELNRRAKALENQLATAEDSELYKNILKKARKTVEDLQKAEFDARLAKYRASVKENQSQTKYRQRVMERATDLLDILTKADTKNIRKRIPVDLQQKIHFPY